MTAAAATSNTPRPFTGRHMLGILLGFFGVVIGANLALVYFASHSWTGLVVKNSYVASQEFNETTARLEAAEAGVHVIPGYRDGALDMRLTGNDGEPMLASNVVVRLGRPSHEGEDSIIILAATGGGHYAASHTLGAGVWSGSISADVVDHPGWSRPIRLLVKG